MSEDCEHLWHWEYEALNIWSGDQWEECARCGAYRDDCDE